MSDYSAHATETLMLSILRGMFNDGEAINLTPLEHLVRWFRVGGLQSNFETDRRFNLFLDALEADSDLKNSVNAYFQQLITAHRYRFTLAELGILANESFGKAMKSRLSLKLLPPALDDKTLRSTLGFLFPKKDDHVWFAKISDTSWFRLIDLMGWQNQAALWKPVRREMLEALELLAVRVAALGVEPELVRCLGVSDRHTSPFVEQLIEFRTMLAQAHERLEANASLRDLGEHLDVLLDQCSQQIRKAHASARVQGVSVDLSMFLIRLEQSIERMKVLLQVLDALPSNSRILVAIQLLNSLIREENRKHSLRDLWSGLTDKLALRITEHASQTGEKYATETAPEYWKMARAAMGAGVVVGFMALIKVWIALLHLPPLWQAVGFSLDYGLGFVLIHMLGFTIATKQPAMTAARIASAIDAANGRVRSTQAIVELIVQVARTQFVAILGNVVMAFATAMLIGYVWMLVFGQAPLPETKAESMLIELNPFQSGALFHAAIAGVFLYLAGVISGYYDNLGLYHQVPDRIRRVQWLRKLLGVVRLGRFSVYLSKNLGALAGNFFFGCMLGSAGFFGFLLGLPIDIRHITFSTSNLAYAWGALGFNIPWPTLALSVLTILAIGTINLAVSFSLAFLTALRARGVKSAAMGSIAKGLGARFLSQPREFFMPPRATKKDVAPSPEDTDRI